MRRREITRAFLIKLIETRVREHLSDYQPERRELNKLLPKVFAKDNLDSVWQDVLVVSTKDNQYIDGIVYNLDQRANPIDVRKLVFIPFTSQKPAILTPQEKAAPSKISKRL